MTDMIKVVEDFSPLPGGRYPEDGEGNGTTFREDFLVPALRAGRVVTIDLDGAPGYPSSFLEEAFGGLVRQKFDPKTIREFIKIRSSEPGYERYIARIWEFVDTAAARVSAT